MISLKQPIPHITFPGDCVTASSTPAYKYVYYLKINMQQPMCIFYMGKCFKSSSTCVKSPRANVKFLNWAYVLGAREKAPTPGGSASRVPSSSQIGRPATANSGRSAKKT